MGNAWPSACRSPRIKVLASRDRQFKARGFRSLARGTRSSSQKSSLGWSDEDDDQESGPGNGPGNDRFDPNEWYTGTATLRHLLRTCPHFPARNVPARCSQTEIEQLLSYVTTDFRLQMPRSSERKCKGYAFIEGLVVFEPGMG